MDPATEDQREPSEELPHATATAVAGVARPAVTSAVEEGEDDTAGQGDSLNDGLTTPRLGYSTSSNSSDDSRTLVNEADTPALPDNDDDDDDDATDTRGTPTDDKDKGKGKGDTIEVLVDRPGYRKELRTSKTGRKYSVVTEGLWTTLRSLTPQLKKKSLKDRLRKRLKEFRTFYPFLIRFAGEVLRLGRWRFLVHLIGSTITGLVPALRIYLSSRLISIAQTASDTRVLRKGELFIVATTSYLSSYLERWIDGLLANNNGILQRRFESMVSEHLINARARLDIQTLNKSRVTKDFSAAASLVHALGDGTFVIGQLIDLFTSAVSLTTQASMLWAQTSAENADLALISVFSAALMLLRWFSRRYLYSMTAITDPHYNRMSLMESMSHPEASTFGERKVLGLGGWVLDEYKKASRALGDVSLAPPTAGDAITTATEAVKAFSDTAIYVLFALKVSEKPLGEATLSMSSLTFIQGAARGLAGSLYRFVRDIQNFGSEFSAFRAYYRVMEVKTAIVEPVEPTTYETVFRRLENGEVRAGMDIEFKNVSFTWPGKKEKALDGMSFKINAGELCAIVGYNGSGKSSAIALMSRLCDPDEGEILINGKDIKEYTTGELHKSMSLLFQQSAELPLTIREFIGIGNMADIANMDKIRQAATDSGAIEFIEKLDKGFESSFTGQIEVETAETLYEDAVAWDESDEESDEEDKDDDDDSDSDSASEDGQGEDTDKDKGKAAPEEPDSKKAASAEEKEEKAVEEKKTEAASTQSEGKGKDAKDSSTPSSSSSSSDHHVDSYNGRLAFSGGQRQKLVMARTFMRMTDLAIFDEYSANLDPVAEHELFKRITANRGKQTILYITHRYSTVRHADRILMLEKGKVTETGTHEELLAIPNGKYAEMCRLALGEGEKDRDSSSSKSRSSSSDDLLTLGQTTPLPPSRPASPSSPAAAA